MCLLIDNTVNTFDFALICSLNQRQIHLDKSNIKISECIVLFHGATYPASDRNKTIQHKSIVSGITVLFPP